MTTSGSGRPPGLGTRGDALWTVTTSGYDLSPSELLLLAEACRLLDECDSLRAAVEAAGTVVAGASGQPRVHPGLGELRQHRLALGRLLGQLALPDEVGDAVAKPASVTARRAARARWDARDRDRGTA